MRQQLGPFFARLMVSWGIPLDFRGVLAVTDLPNTALQTNIREFIARCVHELSAQREALLLENSGSCTDAAADAALALSGSVCLRLECICQHIVLQLFPTL